MPLSLLLLVLTPLPAVHATHDARPASTCAPSPDSFSNLAGTYADAIDELNKDHARKPRSDEGELAKKLSRKARAAFDKLVKAEEKEGLSAALLDAGRAALELDLIEDFKTVRKRLLEVDSARAAELGAAHSAQRFLLIGLGGLDEDYLQHFAEVLEGVLAGVLFLVVVVFKKGYFLLQDTK